MHTLVDVAKAELEVREQLAREVLAIVFEHYVTAPGNVGRGPLQTKVYQQLGFHGRCGNDFAVFINKVLQEQGYRLSFFEGFRIYCGLQLKGPDGLPLPSFKKRPKKKKKVKPPTT